ncbi:MULTISPECIES: hypothetical protein [Pseudomonas syringae group]|nr:hypothetical protein [Pseudomonas syringae group genomosp. 3]
MKPVIRQGDTLQEYGGEELEGHYECLFFMRCSIQGADKMLPLPGDPPILAKKRHPPCRFPLPQRKCLAAFLALPPLRCL